MKKISVVILTICVHFLVQSMETESESTMDKSVLTRGLVRRLREKLERCVEKGSDTNNVIVLYKQNLLFIQEYGCKQFIKYCTKTYSGAYYGYFINALEKDPDYTMYKEKALDATQRAYAEPENARLRYNANAAWEQYYTNAIFLMHDFLRLEGKIAYPTFFSKPNKLKPFGQFAKEYLEQNKHLDLSGEERHMLNACLLVSCYLDRVQEEAEQSFESKALE